MNYQKLFEQTDLLDGGDNFRCLYYRQGGDAELICQSRYPMLFVLQGSLEMRFKYEQCTVETGNIVVIDVPTLMAFCTSPDTIVLVYRPPLRLADFFAQCSKMYDACFSEQVPILPPMQEWIDKLLTEHVQGKVWLNEQAHQQCRELARILIKYTRQQLGELYAAFSTCTMGDCEKCQMEVYGTE